MHSAYSSTARLISPRFTCDECVAGMEWIEAYLEDPIFQVILSLMKFWPGLVSHVFVKKLCH